MSSGSSRCSSRAYSRCWEVQRCVSLCVNGGVVGMSTLDKVRLAVAVAFLMLAFFGFLYGFFDRTFSVDERLFYLSLGCAGFLFGPSFFKRNGNGGPK